MKQSIQQNHFWCFEWFLADSLLPPPPSPLGTLHVLWKAPKKFLILVNFRLLVLTNFVLKFTRWGVFIWPYQKLGIIRPNTSWATKWRVQHFKIIFRLIPNIFKILLASCSTFFCCSESVIELGREWVSEWVANNHLNQCTGYHFLHQAFHILFNP